MAEPAVLRLPAEQRPDGQNAYRNTIVLSAALMAVVAMAVVLRTWRLGEVPFWGSDDIGTVWATVWYFPRGLRSFTVGDGSVEPNPIGIITLIHGPLQALIAFATVVPLGWLGVPLTERVWHLPFALLGSATVLAMYALGTQWQSRRAGLLAALFGSVLPLHVAFSRTSGESHFVLASLLQASSLALWSTYLARGSPRWALATGLTVAADVLTDFSLPALLVALFATTYLHTRAVVRVPVRHTVGELVQWRMLVPVLAAASVHGFALVAALRGARVGMFGRVLSEGELGTTRTGGVFLASVIANLFHAMSGLAVAVVAACAIAYALYPRLRTTSATMALIWSMACLLPFLVGVDRARLVGHYIPGSVALCVFTALILDRVIVGRTAIGIAAALAMTVSLLTATLSSVFRVAVPALFAHAPDHGSLAGDPGTKAAAWWIRQNTAPGALVYADGYAELSPAVSLYYFHRPVASAELDGHSTVSGMFEQVGSAVDVLVIGAERVPLLPATLAARFQPRAVVTVDGKPTLYILLRGSAETGAEPQRLEAGELNSRYDAHYATLSEITALPLREIQAHQRSAPP